VLGFRPDPEDDFADIWDELVMGTERKLGWLGKPLGPAVHAASRQQDVLGGVGAPPAEELLDHLEGKDARFTHGGEGIKLTSSGGSELRFALTDLRCEGPELTVLLRVKAAPKEGYPAEYARLMVASPEEGLPFPNPMALEMNESNRFETFVNGSEFTSGFFFRQLERDRVDVEFTVEGPEPIWITGVEAYCHPDAMYREFEQGLVLANPSDHPYEFDLAELFPDQDFRRIRGSANQDPKTNDGSAVDGSVSLQARDGLFLVKAR
jgi:hypothetical protein